MESRTQVVLLAALVVVLAALAWGRLGGGDSAPPAGAAAQGGPAAQTGERATAGVADVWLELLAAGTRDLTDAERNPFRFGSLALPPVPSPPLPTPVVTPRPVPIVPRPAAASIPLRYIGVFDLPGQPGLVAVLSDNRGRVFHEVEGDVIEGQYRVLRVGPESADLAFLDGRGQQTLGMSGQ